MKKILLLAVAIAAFSHSFSQTAIKFKTGDFTPEVNIENEAAFNFSPNEEVDGKYYRLLQFSVIPDELKKETLKNNGITLLNYIPKNTFYASIDKQVNFQLLKDFNVISVIKIEKQHKLSPELLYETYDDWALVNNNQIIVNGVFFENISKAKIAGVLSKHNFKIIKINDFQVARIQLNIKDLDKLYSLPEFYYFEQIDPPALPENLPGVTDHRSNTLATSYSSGLKYDGTGVNVMMQDDGTIGPHIDYTGRMIERVSGNSGDHGDHVAGTIMGAGNIDPTARGMAFGANLYVFSSSDNNYDSIPNLYNNEGVVITSKSYSNGCNAGYTSLTRELDQQIRTMPSLIHVFSAGNSGTSDCGYGAGAGWGNITGGHKQGKNVIATGNLTYQDGLANSSSRGPAHDGRIKPDICAVGTNVYSTIDVNTYDYKTGTSMACPGVSGTLAQLYHAYKDMNGGSNPPSALIKAAVLNTGEDLGNPGPDFKYGWGRINARRAYNLLSAGNYLNATVSQGGSNNHTITVPANTKQLRVMVYWPDYEATASASVALINDLNMQVTDPSSTTYDPWILDPTPNPVNLDLPATRGVDNLNNMEQVTIDNPASGNYTVTVDGFSVPQGPQTYYIVYEFVADEVTLTYPIGGEGFVPGETETIRWDANDNGSTFNLEYSTDNGSTWTTIVNGIPSYQKYYDWTVPNIVTGQALVRITRGANVDVSDDVFTIIGLPTGITINWACPDSMEVAWNAVTGATAYEVSLLGNKYMDSVGTTNGAVTSLVVLAPANVDHWVSVKAIAPNNGKGRRANAVFKTAGTFGCILPVDANLTAATPSNGTTIFSCQVPNVDISITIQNDGTSSLTNVPVHYSVNGGTAVNETYTGAINVGNSYTYTFSQQPVLSAGPNTIVIWADYPSDGNAYNDTITLSINYSNAVKSLPWNEDFETYALCATTSDCEQTVCPVGNEWSNESNGTIDDIDWRVNEGSTPSNNTGPSQDYNPGSTIGNYVYTEASGGCNGQEADLVTPCIDLTGVSNPELTYAYHMDGSNMGQLHVDIKVNNVWINDITTPVSGDQGASWLTNTVNLSAYVGNVVNIRFRGITGSGYMSDIALDDIGVTENTTGIVETELQGFSFYPNPSDGNLQFTFYNESVRNLNVQLYDLQGRMVYTNQINKQGNYTKGNINVSHLAKGVYTMKIIAGEQQKVEKVVLY
ncbi:MAG: hypothetical protein Kow0079_12870 [Vicingaceae bacterium]